MVLSAAASPVFPLVASPAISVVEDEAESVDDGVAPSLSREVDFLKLIWQSRNTNVFPPNSIEKRRTFSHSY